MKVFEAFKIAFSSIIQNKMRSLLTMLGLIIGIASVVTVVSLGEGTQNDMLNEFSSLGINTVTVYENKDVKLPDSEKLNLDDIEALNEYFKDDIESISPRMNVAGDIIMNIDDTSVSLKGAIKETLESEDLTLISGRFLNDFDINSNKRNIVISSDLSETVNKKVGDGILIKARKTTYSYNIVGIYESQSSLGGFELESIYIPYTTINYMSNLGGRVGSIQIDFNDDIDFEKAKSDIINVLERTNRNIGEDLYKTFSADDMIDNISNALGQMTLFITAIAGISLLVGGIGIMNIMLVSVTERTREIGTRKAVGAKYRDIMLQFLIESTVISLIGGLLGAIFGIIITNIAGKMMSISSVFSIEALVVAFVFSTLIGLFFGIYPANKAAKLNPIDALRYE